MSNNKFESLLELLINEENDKAEALFHEIVVEKSREIYENLADEEVTAEAKEESKEEVKETEASEEAKVEETAEEKVEETTEEAKDEKVEETSEESKDEQVDEVVELEDEATESETTEEESIEEVGGDATDELVKDISSEEEGEMDADKGEEMPADMDADKGEEDMEDRVVDLEDALDELKAEFEAMMSKKDDGEEKEEAVQMPAQETPEMPVEGKKADMKKEKMDEYKIQKSADNADHADSKSSPVKDAGSKMPKGGDNIAKGSAEEKGRPAPTAQKMSGDFENTGGKDKSTSFKKQEKADTSDKSDKSAKSPVASK